MRALIGRATDGGADLLERWRASVGSAYDG